MATGDSPPTKDYVFTNNTTDNLKPAYTIGTATSGQTIKWTGQPVTLSSMQWRVPEVPYSLPVVIDMTGIICLLSYSFCETLFGRDYFYQSLNSRDISTLFHLIGLATTQLTGLTPDKILEQDIHISVHNYPLEDTIAVKLVSRNNSILNTRNITTRNIVYSSKYALVNIDQETLLAWYEQNKGLHSDK